MCKFQENGHFINIFKFVSTDPATIQSGVSDTPFGDVLLAGPWSPDFVCLLRIAHGGIGLFTAVLFRSLRLIKMSTNRTGWM